MPPRENEGQAQCNKQVIGGNEKPVQYLLEKKDNRHVSTSR